MADEYPLALSPSNLKNVRVIRDQERYLSHAVAKPLIIKTPVGLIKMAAIGSVVTDPEFRNLGMSSQTISSCLDLAAAEGCDLAILWTDLYDFYRKQEFELAGSEVTLEVFPQMAVEPLSLRVLKGPQVSAEALLRVFHQHTVTSLRKASDIERCLRIPNSRVYTAWNQQNQLMAYAVEGKGLDLGGYIHEWGGNVTSLLFLAQHIAKDQNKPIRLIAPGHSMNLIQQLTQAGAKPHFGYLGMLRWIDPARFFKKVKNYASARGLQDLVLEAQGQELFIGKGDKVYRTSRPADLLPLIFGPTKPSELQLFDLEVSLFLEKIFPIPFWVWGWDSI